MRKELIYKELNNKSIDIDFFSKKLAENHMKLIPEGFLSSLNINFITLLYKSLIYSNDFYVLVCLDKENNNKIVGYALARLKNSSYIKTVFKFNPTKTFYLSIGNFLNPKKLFGFIELFIYQLFKNPSKGGLANSKKVAELFNIAIIKSYRRKGIGKELLCMIKTKCSSIGIDYLYAVTGSSDINTHIFYKKNGGKEEGQTTVHNNHISKIYKIETKNEPK